MHNYNNTDDFFINDNNNQPINNEPFFPNQSEDDLFRNEYQDEQQFQDMIERNQRTAAQDYDNNKYVDISNHQHKYAQQHDNQINQNNNHNYQTNNNYYPHTAQPINSSAQKVSERLSKRGIVFSSIGFGFGVAALVGALIIYIIMSVISYSNDLANVLGVMVYFIIDCIIPSLVFSIIGLVLSTRQNQYKRTKARVFSILGIAFSCVLCFIAVMGFFVIMFEIGNSYGRVY